MALASRQRWLMIGGALAVTLALMAWVGDETGEEVSAPAKSASAPPTATPESAPAPPPSAAPSPSRAQGTTAAPGAGKSPATASLVLARPGQGSERKEVRDIFAKQTWVPPPPPVEAGPPEPPPLPFTYLGRMVEGGRVTVYLADAQERNLAVRPGEVIDGVYKLQKVSPTTLTFFYIPMKKQQTLEIGRTN